MDDRLMIIGLMGEARSGKDTVAKHLDDNYEFEVTAFAQGLKHACKNVFGFTVDQLWGDSKEVNDPFWDMTPRYVMQYVGTELFRNWIPDIWIKCLERYIKQIDPDNTGRWVISDVRFKNEKQAIESWGGEVWKLKRLGGPGASNGIEGHASETELLTIPETEFAEVITAPSGVPNLLRMVDDVCKRRNIK